MPDAKKPSPLDDVSKGLGLLFRAAKTTVERLPTERIEDLVTEGAKEVGRALETVGGVIEREVLGKKSGSAPPPSPGNSSDPAHAPHAPPDATRASDASSHAASHSGDAGSAGVNAGGTSTPATGTTKPAAASDGTPSASDPTDAPRGPRIG